MKVVLKDAGNFVLRFDSGDDVFKELENFCKKNEIRAGWLSALGSASDVTLAFYNPHTRAFEEKTITAPTELLSLTGNLSVMNGHITIHAHGAVADQNYWMSGGHVKRLIAGPTVEMHFTHIAGTLKRVPDLKTRLNLLK